jgi:aryl-alcohol dehydrogenase-like predicted oxidoreductase
MTQPTIPQRTLGSQGLRVSALGLGCMGFSEFYGDAASRAAVDGVSVIHHAIDRGITLLDTADMYGPYTNEELVGRAVQGRRNKVVIATKFGIVRDAADPTRRGVNGRPEYVRASCEGSLRRLGVETIDLYYQHRRDKTIPSKDVGAMAQGARGQGALPRPIRGLTGNAPAGVRHAPHCGRAERVVAVDTGLGAHHVRGGARFGRRHRAVQSARQGLPHGDGHRGDDVSRGRLPAHDASIRRRQRTTNLRWSRRSRRWPRTGDAPAQAALAWVLSRGDDGADSRDKRPRGLTKRRCPVRAQRRGTRAAG